MSIYYFLVNPNSRSGAGKTVWLSIKKELELKKISYEVYMTRYVGHAKKLAAHISRKGSPSNPVHLIALGGDGTIHEVFSGISDPDSVIFGFIPTGSGNDFCRGMHIPQNAPEALDTILREEYITELDMPSVEAGKDSLHFGISTGIGYDAAVCHEVSASQAKIFLNRLHLGKLVYLFVALKQILFTKPEEAILTLDNNRTYHFKKMYFAAVMNQPYEGGGFKFCPEASPGDGFLDIIVVDSMPKLMILCCLPLAFPGKHTRIPGIHIFRSKQVTVACKSPLPIHVDGEEKGIRKTLSVGIGGKKLRMIV
ncbi:MAG: diacylglycerol kinase family lipid kinase [Eubacteriales bacterium]|nr:diacylglycerol kinase family lipid kinase [Eubacteriales bacterium]